MLRNSLAAGRLVLAGVLALLTSGCTKHRPKLPTFETAIAAAAPQVIMDNRSWNVQSSSGLRTTLRRGNSPVASPDLAQYQTFVDQALLVRATSVVENSDFQHDFTNPGTPGLWTFPSLIRRTFPTLGFQGTGAGADPFAADVYNWTNMTISDLPCRWRENDSRLALNTIPLRLLAVVNRFDLAQQGGAGCPPNLSCGAEFRFVYAGDTLPTGCPLAANPFFTLILEYQLPAMNGFQLPGLNGGEPFDLVSSWYNLGSVPVAIYPGALEKQLGTLFDQWKAGLRKDGKSATLADSQVRFRFTSLTSGQLVWDLGQTQLTNAGFVRETLDQQWTDDFPVNQCISKPLAKEWNLDGILSQPDQVIATNYNFNPQSKACTQLPKPPTCTAELNFTPPQTVLTLLPEVAHQPPDTDEVRYALSIGSCKGCHGLETHGTLATNDQYDFFNQIKYRAKGSPSKLSQFLTGSQTANDDPTLEIGWTVNPPVVSDCGATPAPRVFNDLLRRTILLYLLSHPFVFPIPPGVPPDRHHIQAYTIDQVNRRQFVAHQSH